MKNGFTIIGLLFLVLGGMILADGILPVRSQNPNPSFLEILFGLGVGFVGWIIRQRGEAPRRF